MSKWIEVIAVPGWTGKTGRWMVRSKRTGELCGTIKWYYGFRGYAFYPTDGFLFDSKCLAMIAEFIDNQMLWRKKSKASVK